MSISTAVDANAVARVVGIKTAYKNLRRNGVAILPQRLAVFGQGSTASTFPTDKRAVISALEAGQVYGFGSPIHLAVAQLLPVTGDGVGVIPVTVYPLDDGDVSAEGSITPSGAQVTSASYRVVASAIRSSEFNILAGDSVTTICRAIHTAILSTLDMPVLPTFEYGTVTSQAGVANGGDGTVTVLSVVGTPVPGAYVLTCTGEVANGGVFELVGPDGDLIADDITLTPGVGGATVVAEGGIQFTVTDGAADFEDGDFFTITVLATAVNVTAKWAGLSGNEIDISVSGSLTAGVTFAVVQPVGGLGDPEVTTQLAAIGNVWETMILNCLQVSNDSALDAYETFGESRWGALVKKPLVVFTGTLESTVATAITIPDARTQDRVNCVIPFPGCPNLPWVAAARALARIAYMANENPAHDYGSQRLTGLTAGADSAQWDYLERNLAVTSGCSTTEVQDSVIRMSDTVTCYHPEGDLTPPYRFVVDIVKLQNIIFNIDMIFTGPEWDGAPLIPNEQPTTNRTAKKPKAAVSELCRLWDNLGLEAIISDPDSAKASTVAEIDDSNPKRLNVTAAVALSGNSNIRSVDFNFGFLFGTPSIIS